MKKLDEYGNKKYATEEDIEALNEELRETVKKLGLAKQQLIQMMIDDGELPKDYNGNN